MAHQAGAYPGFCIMKRLGVFLIPPPPGWDASPRRVTPSIKFAGTHLYTWVERGTVRVKCLAKEHNTMSSARARTQTARSGNEHTNHEATAPPDASLGPCGKRRSWQGLFESTKRKGHSHEISALNPTKILTSAFF